MIKHGFSYTELREMSLEEIKFWAEQTSSFYEKLKEELTEDS
jgi:hypothetical protein